AGYQQFSWMQSRGGLLEWQVNGRYFNAIVPLANAWMVTPREITHPAETIHLQVAGDNEAWLQSALHLKARSDFTSLGGTRTFEADRLSFTPQAGLFELDEVYELTLDQQPLPVIAGGQLTLDIDRKSTRLNSSHVKISYAVFCLKKKSRFCHRYAYDTWKTKDI